MTEREFFIQKWSEELPLTLGVFEALPSDKLDYQPHEKSRTVVSIRGRRPNLSYIFNPALSRPWRARAPCRRTL